VLKTESLTSQLRILSINRTCCACYELQHALIHESRHPATAANLIQVDANCQGSSSLYDCSYRYAYGQDAAKAVNEILTRLFATIHPLHWCPPSRGICLAATTLSFWSGNADTFTFQALFQNLWFYKINFRLHKTGDQNRITSSPMQKLK